MDQGGAQRVGQLGQRLLAQKPGHVGGEIGAGRELVGIGLEEVARLGVELDLEEILDALGPDMIHALHQALDGLEPALAGRAGHQGDAAVDLDILGLAAAHRVPEAQRQIPVARQKRQLHRAARPRHVGDAMLDMTLETGHHRADHRRRRPVMRRHRADVGQGGVAQQMKSAIEAPIEAAIGHGDQFGGGYLAPPLALAEIGNGRQGPAVEPMHRLFHRVLVDADMHRLAGFQPLGGEIGLEQAAGLDHGGIGRTMDEIENEIRRGGGQDFADPRRRPMGFGDDADLPAGLPGLLDQGRHVGVEHRQLLLGGQLGGDQSGPDVGRQAEGGDGEGFIDGLDGDARHQGHAAIVLPADTQAVLRQIAVLDEAVGHPLHPLGHRGQLHRALVQPVHPEAAPLQYRPEQGEGDRRHALAGDQGGYVLGRIDGHRVSLLWQGFGI